MWCVCVCVCGGGGVWVCVGVCMHYAVLHELPITAQSLYNKIHNLMNILSDVTLNPQVLGTNMSI